MSDWRDLQAENASLRAALKRYADPANWGDGRDGDKKHHWFGRGSTGWFEAQAVLAAMEAEVGNG